MIFRRDRPINWRFDRSENGFLPVPEPFPFIASTVLKDEYHASIVANDIEIEEMVVVPMRRAELEIINSFI